MKKNFLAFLVLVFSCSISGAKAQTDRPVKIFSETVKELAAKPGTYQFIYHPSKVQYLFTSETLIVIEKNRDEKETKYVWLTPTVQVKILSKEYIQSAKFIPLDEVIHVDQ